MSFTIEAACSCNTGKIRRHNEDNFYFDGRCLEIDNDGLKYPVITECDLKKEFCVSIFDGMGGENFGEYASFAAARKMQQIERKLTDFFISPKQYLYNLVFQLNEEILKVQQEKCTEHMGTTMVSLYFTGKYIYSCNLGDSRAYRLRDGEFLQLSEEHIAKRPGSEYKKAPLTRYLGIDTQEMEIEPYIAKGKLKKGDKYLICSDGLTDMLTNFEISDIMLKCKTVEECVSTLTWEALEHGGRDNVTAIICEIK